MEDVAKVFRIAAKYRQKFQTDVVIDLVGYRKYGHNELDQPMFTQPLMYEIIKNMPSVASKYESQILAEKNISEEELNNIKSQIDSDLDKGFKRSENHKYKT